MALLPATLAILKKIAKEAGPATKGVSKAKKELQRLIPFDVTGLKGASKIKPRIDPDTGQHLPYQAQEEARIRDLFRALEEAEPPRTQPVYKPGQIARKLKGTRQVTDTPKSLGVSPYGADVPSEHRYRMETLHPRGGVPGEEGIGQEFQITRVHPRPFWTGHEKLTPEKLGLGGKPDLIGPPGKQMYDLPQAQQATGGAVDVKHFHPQPKAVTPDPKQLSIWGRQGIVNVRGAASAAQNVPRQHHFTGTQVNPITGKTERFDATKYDIPKGKKPPEEKFHPIAGKQAKKRNPKDVVPDEDYDAVIAQVKSEASDPTNPKRAEAVNTLRLFLLLHGVGGRIVADLRRIKPSNFHWDTGRINLAAPAGKKTAKTKERSMRILDEDAKMLLEEMQQASPDDLIFSGIGQGHRNPDKSFSDWANRKIDQYFVKGRGLDKLTNHNFRHNYGLKLMEPPEVSRYGMGWSLEDVAEEMGHVGGDQFRETLAYVRKGMDDSARNTDILHPELRARMREAEYAKDPNVRQHPSNYWNWVADAAATSFAKTFGNTEHGGGIFMSAPDRVPMGVPHPAGPYHSNSYRLSPHLSDKHPGAQEQGLLKTLEALDPNMEKQGAYTGQVLQTLGIKASLQPESIGEAATQMLEQIGRGQPLPTDASLIRYVNISTGGSSKEEAVEFLKRGVTQAELDQFAQAFSREVWLFNSTPGTKIKGELVDAIARGSEKAETVYTAQDPALILAAAKAEGILPQLAATFIGRSRVMALANELTEVYGGRALNKRGHFEFKPKALEAKHGDQPQGLQGAVQEQAERVGKALTQETHMWRNLGNIGPGGKRVNAHILTVLARFVATGNTKKAKQFLNNELKVNGKTLKAHKREIDKITAQLFLIAGLTGMATPFTQQPGGSV